MQPDLSVEACVARCEELVNTLLLVAADKSLVQVRMKYLDRGVLEARMVSPRPGQDKTWATVRAVFPKLPEQERCVDGWPIVSDNTPVMARER